MNQADLQAQYDALDKAYNDAYLAWEASPPPEHVPGTPPNTNPPKPPPPVRQVPHGTVTGRPCRILTYTSEGTVRWLCSLDDGTFNNDPDHPGSGPVSSRWFPAGPIQTDGTTAPMNVEG